MATANVRTLRTGVAIVCLFAAGWLETGQSRAGSGQSPCAHPPGSACDADSDEDLCEEGTWYCGGAVSPYLQGLDQPPPP